jgi:hypothetical protein
MKAATKLGLMLWVQIGAIFASASTNDDFAKRLPIVTNSVITNAFLSTLEPGEPTHGANFTAGSIWWAWTPPNTGTYRIQCIVPNTGSALAIYTGTNLVNLKVSATSEGSVLYWGRVLIDFHADAGVEYAIAATYIPIDDSPLLLEIHTPPVHDSFSAALTLTLNVPRTNKFVVATLELGETAAFNRGSVWYTWTAPHSGSFIFATHLLNGYYDNTLSIYTGSGVTNLTRVPSFEYQSNATLAVAFRAQQSVSYHLSLEMLTSPYERTVTATILSGHPHDDLTNAAPLSGLFAAWTNTMFGATSEPGEEVFSPHQASVWSQWTAPESGTVLRWTATSSDHTSSFWLDDIEFIPAPPRAPQLTIDNDGMNGARLNFVVQGHHTITIDTSTNLIDWLPWTNLFSLSSISSILPLPAPTNTIPQFFRAHVVRLNETEASSVAAEPDR